MFNISDDNEKGCAITGLDISYDGRLAITTHSSGIGNIWDIKFGCKIGVLNKHRKQYSQCIVVCDRLGAFAGYSDPTVGVANCNINGSGSNNPKSNSSSNNNSNNNDNSKIGIIGAGSDSDIKYEKHTLYCKNWPLICKRYFTNDQFKELKNYYKFNNSLNLHNSNNNNNNKHNSMNTNGSGGVGINRNINNSLISPPEYMSIYLPNGQASAACDMVCVSDEQLNDCKINDGVDNKISFINNGGGGGYLNKRVGCGFSYSSYATNSLWSDDTSFLNQIEDEFAKISNDNKGIIQMNQSLQGLKCIDKNNRNGMRNNNNNDNDNNDDSDDSDDSDDDDMIKFSSRKKKKTRKKSKNQKIDKLRDGSMVSVEELLHENKLLKGEIEQWKRLHSNLFRYTCKNVLQLEDKDIQNLDDNNMKL